MKTQNYPCEETFLFAVSPDTLPSLITMEPPMPASLDALKSQAQALTPAERVDLAAFLLGGVDPATGDDPHWRAEIARRVAEIRAGAIVGRDVDEVVDEL